MRLSLALATSSFAALPNIILMMGDDHGWENRRSRLVVRRKERPHSICHAAMP